MAAKKLTSLEQNIPSKMLLGGKLSYDAENAQE